MRGLIEPADVHGSRMDVDPAVVTVALGIARLTRGSSFGAMGIWGDYVFVDVDGRVLFAVRRFLD